MKEQTVDEWWAGSWCYRIVRREYDGRPVLVLLSAPSGERMRERGMDDPEALLERIAQLVEEDL